MEGRKTLDQKFPNLPQLTKDLQAHQFRETLGMSSSFLELADSAGGGSKKPGQPIESLPHDPNAGSMAPGMESLYISKLSDFYKRNMPLKSKRGGKDLGKSKTCHPTWWDGLRSPPSHLEALRSYHSPSHLMQQSA